MNNKEELQRLRDRQLDDSNIWFSHIGGNSDEVYYLQQAVRALHVAIKKYVEED